MDPKIRDESRNRRREEALARRLGEALDQTDLRGTDLCPDAESIAAYNERALELEEAARCEEHFVACSRCRKILAVLAASADTPLADKEVARLGELVAAASSPRGAALQPAVPPHSNLLHWRARWLAPALGVAAVLAVWFAMRPPWRSADQGASRTLIAQTPQNEPAPPEPTSPVDEVSNARPTKGLDKNSANSSRDLGDLPSTKTESGEPETSAKNKSNDRSAIAALTPRAKGADSAPADEKKDQLAMNSAAGTARGSVPSPAPVPPTDSVALAQGRSRAAEQAAPSAPQAPGSASPSFTVTSEAPPVETAGSVAGGAIAGDKQATPGKTAANLPINGRNFQSLAILDKIGENALQIRDPSGKIVWRAGKSGRIERSTNAGSTWTSATSPLRDDWLSGAAASDKVCWIVGRNGAIARTVDGQHWEKVSPPPMSADASGKFPDWIDVKASSAEVATITASDQRHYSTQDGGKTWQ